ncbi:MAG: hypothetical protein R6V01_05585 [Thermoplasmatota archaeon]
MALDMEGEFYKLARNILSKPKKLYKMAALAPRSGRVAIMGADGFVMVGSSILRSFTRGPEKKAYRVGKKAGKEMFGSLIKEFDEEIKDLPPSKLLDLGRMLVSSLGWGDISVKDINKKKGRVIVHARRTVELKYKRSKHHQLTNGMIAGVATMAMGREMDGEVVEENTKSVTFVLNGS